MSSIIWIYSSFKTSFLEGYENNKLKYCIIINEPLNKIGLFKIKKESFTFNNFDNDDTKILIKSFDISQINEFDDIHNNVPILKNYVKIFERKNKINKLLTN